MLTQVIIILVLILALIPLANAVLLFRLLRKVKLREVKGLIILGIIETYFLINLFINPIKDGGAFGQLLLVELVGCGLLVGQLAAFKRLNSNNQIQ